MSHRGDVTQTIKSMPKERLIQKIARSAFGMLFIGGSAAMAYTQITPWWVWLPTAMFGAHVISAELTRAGVKFLVATIKDLLAAIKNGKTST